MRQHSSRVPGTAVAVLSIVTLAAGADVVRANHLGTWEGPFCLPNVGTHMVHLHTGQILLWPGHYATEDSIEAWLWNLDPQCLTDNPNPGFDPQCIEQVNNDETNLFCSGHAPLDDGTVLATGGHHPNFGNNLGLPDANLFDPEKKLWSGQDDGVAAMAFRRWYPTSTTLPDGRILTLSGSDRRCDGGPHDGENCTSHASCSEHGSCQNDVCVGGDHDGEACTAFADCLNDTGTCDDVFVADLPEVFDPATRAWTTLNGASLSLPFYPLMFLLPDGDVFYAGAELEVGDSIATTQNYVLDVANEVWTFVAASNVNGGSGVMYEPGKVLKTGGRSGSAASDGAQIIDLNQNNPAWQNVPNMSAARVVHNSTLLPDGTVLVTGGTRFFNREYNHFCVGGSRDGEECSPPNLPPGDSGFVCVTGHPEENCPEGGTCSGGDGAQQWVSQAELFDPATNTWTTLAHMATPRQYHSTAVLLPDGRVVMAGGGQGSGAIHDYSNYEIFSPPYKFLGPGPTVSEAPPWFSPGDQFLVETPDPDAIVKAALIRLAAATHGFDQNQRYVPLAFQTQTTDIQITGAVVNGQDVPFDHNVVPPGYYMLFLLNEDGVPSTGRYIRMLGDTPIALCQDVDTTTDPGLCTADVSIDDGSFDPTGEALTFEQTPASPYPVGTTEVSLMVTDPKGLSDMCAATVTVTDDEPPVPECNAPATIVPPDAPISFTATATDNCGVESVAVVEPDCFMLTNKGKRIDKTSSCSISVVGDTITIEDSGGVNDHISWKISVTDVNGNTAEGECELVVANPGQP
jgi:hypothetical protein